MRLWSLHPSLLDQKGLVALWREGLLAQKVLLGATRGYRFHPQLRRFQATRKPLASIGCYLAAVAREADGRGYRFDASKIVRRTSSVVIAVTRGQLEFEKQHLLRKLRVRDPAAATRLRASRLRAHPMLRVIAGKIEAWEVV